MGRDFAAMEAYLFHRMLFGQPFPLLRKKLCGIRELTQIEGDLFGFVADFREKIAAGTGQDAFL